jgi:hypothetical protein
VNSGSDRQRHEVDPETGKAEDSGNGNQENGRHRTRRTHLSELLNLVAKQKVKGSAFRNVLAAHRKMATVVNL